MPKVLKFNHESDSLKELCSKIHDSILSYQNKFKPENKIVYQPSQNPPVILEKEHLVRIELNSGLLVLCVVSEFYHDTPDGSVSDWIVVNDLSALRIDVREILNFQVYYPEKPPEKIIEKWECTSCSSKEYPCLIEIHSRNSDLDEHLDKHTKFRRKLCICDNALYADWKQITELKEGE